MPALRSHTVTHGRNMAVARGAARDITLIAQLDT